MRSPRQFELVFSSRGGFRRGAGRKPGPGRRKMPHRKRPTHHPHHPVHVTLRVCGRRARSTLVGGVVRRVVRRDAPSTPAVTGTAGAYMAREEGLATARPRELERGPARRLIRQISVPRTRKEPVKPSISQLAETASVVAPLDLGFNGLRRFGAVWEPRPTSRGCRRHGRPRPCSHPRTAFLGGFRIRKRGPAHQRSASADRWTHIDRSGVARQRARDDGALASGHSSGSTTLLHRIETRAPCSMPE